MWCLYMKQLSSLTYWYALHVFTTHYCTCKHHLIQTHSPGPLSSKQLKELICSILPITEAVLRQQFTNTFFFLLPLAVNKSVYLCCILSNVSHTKNEVNSVDYDYFPKHIVSQKFLDCVCLFAFYCLLQTSCIYDGQILINCETHLHVQSCGML